MRQANKGTDELMRAFVGPTCIAVLLVWCVVGAPARAQDAKLAPGLPETGIRLTQDGHYKTRPVWFPDGTRLLYSKHVGKRIDLVSIKAAGGDERPVGDSKEQKLFFDAAIAPDAKTIAFTYLGIANNQGDADIYLMDADGLKPRPLAVNDKKLSHEEWASWSPDGKQVAFSSSAPGNQEIFVIHVDGSNRRRLTQHPGTDSHPTWSPDGKSIAFATDRWGGLEIAIMDVDGANIRRITKSPGLDDYPTWSPDGKRLAFVSNRDGNLQIYCANADGSQSRNVSRSNAQDTYPCWAPDGKSICFVHGVHQKFDILLLVVSN